MGSVNLDASEVTQCFAKLYGVARGGAVYTKGDLKLIKSAIRHSKVYEVPARPLRVEERLSLVILKRRPARSTTTWRVVPTASYGQGGGVYTLGNVDIESSSIFSNSAAIAGGLFFLPVVAVVRKSSTAPLASNSASL